MVLVPVACAPPPTATEDRATAPLPMATELACTAIALLPTAMAPLLRVVAPLPTATRSPLAPPPTLAMAACSCCRFTASVLAVPAATLTMRRCWLLLPTLTTLAALATLPAPSATLFSASGPTVALAPSATALRARASASVPTAVLPMP